MLRIVLGFALAPMPILLPIIWVAIGADAENPHAASLQTIATVVYGPTLLFGVPTHALLRRFGRRRLWHYLAAAMALPVLAALAVFIMEIIESDSRITLGAPAATIGSTLAIPAAIIALLFWLIAIWRSPEPGQIARTKLSAVFH